MSHDGSSSKSYIKHPTEKARLDNLAFTTFPEDYLPYTSPTYQKKAPYLVWDDGGSKFRSKRCQCCRSLCGCGPVALATAIAVLIAAILAIVAVSVYLGVVTSSFRSPILSLSGRFRVLEGDDFEDSLLNHTSYEFITKAGYYKTLVENTFLSSSLEPAFIAARVYAFRRGSLLVFFRVHLDRRKLKEETPNTIVAAKNLFIEEAIMAPKPTFDNLILDDTSINIQEHGDEDLLSQDSNVKSGDTDSLKQELGYSKAFSKSNELTRLTSKSVPSFVTSSPKNTHEVTEVNKHSIGSSTSKPSTIVHKSDRGNNDGQFGYAEWKPVELPDPIRVANLGLVPSTPERKDKPDKSGKGSVTITENTSLHVNQNKPVLNTAPKPPPSQPSVSSIMSSVSLVIRPNNKNASTELKETGVGVVRVLSPEESRFILPLEDEKSEISKNPLSETRRIDLASFRELNLDDDVETSPQNGADVEVKESDIFLRNNAFSERSDLMADYEDSFENTSNTSNVNNLSEQPQSDEYLVDNSNPDSYTAKTEEIATLNSSLAIPTDQLQTERDNWNATNAEIIVERVEVTSGVEYSQTSDTENSVDIGSITSTESAVDNISEGTESTDASDSEKHSVITKIFNFMETAIATIEEFEHDNLSISSFLEPNRTTEESSTSQITVLNFSTSPTKFEILDSTPQNATGEILDGSGNIAHDVSGSSQSEVSTVSAGDTQSDNIITSISLESAQDETSIPQVFGVRKIPRPLRNSAFNRNDINDKNNFKDSAFNQVSRFPVTISVIEHTTAIIDHINVSAVTEDENINAIHGGSTAVPTLASTNISWQDSKKPSTSCSRNEFLCENGECIPSDYRCNMRRDCKDNSDEQYCLCSQYLTVIGQSQKICDGINDCWDYSDENNCPWCNPGQFMCPAPSSKSCINMTQVCDGVNDCPFGADERHCVKLAYDEPSASGIEYHSEGFLMVRKSGKWGKLCMDSLNDVHDTESAKWKLDDLGKVVCSALSYNELEEAVQVLAARNDNQTFYEIAPHPSKSTIIFKSSECRSRDIAHVRCHSLECGIRPLAVTSSRRRIVGGQSTGTGTWPWQVALYKEGEFQCGAVIVSDIWLISAGHCFFSTQTAYWTARMGLLRRGAELTSPTEYVRRIVQIILHPDYVDKGFINDIVLLRIEQPIPFSDYLRPLCLPSESEDIGLWHGQHCSVVGWGKLYEIGHIFPDSLQEVRLPVISTEECRKRIMFLSMYHITDNMFCAGFELGGRDACLGDSGGPLMCQRRDGRWVLLGITSNGDGCGRPGRPGVYTKVTKYLDWIYDVISEDVQPNVTDDKCPGHRCTLGRCVRQQRVCDGRFDCADGSDEMNCPS